MTFKKVKSTLKPNEKKIWVCPRCEAERPSLSLTPNMFCGECGVLYEPVTIEPCKHTRLDYCTFHTICAYCGEDLTDTLGLGPIQP